MEYKNLTSELPVIGFTGAIGSGCTTFAKELEKSHDYVCRSLSGPVRDEAKNRNGGAEVKDVQVLQDVGNKMRREEGRDILVNKVMKKIDEDWPDIGNGKKGIIIDSIKNEGEIEALRYFSNFFLFSIQADQEKRWQRIFEKRFKEKSNFQAADKRDAEEKTIYGQQIKRCNYLSDINIVNEEDIEIFNEDKRRKFVTEKIYDRYVKNIELIAKGDSCSPDFLPSPEETLMTIAYIESKRSSCLKRKVGAVITTKGGNILSVAHNEVPPNMATCFKELKRCHRDIVQEEIGQSIKHCPECGTAISVLEKCWRCGSPIESYLKECPKCHEDPDIDYICPKCKTNIFREFIVGKSSRSGKLLDICRAMHAEENALINLTKSGAATAEGSILYSTTYPCNLCANKIVSTSIKTVIYSEPYTVEAAEDIFKKNGIKINKFGGIKSNKYFRFFK